jgi:hypothetical protein
LILILRLKHLRKKLKVDRVELVDYVYRRNFSDQ